MKIVVDKMPKSWNDCIFADNGLTCKLDSRTCYANKCNKLIGIEEYHQDKKKQINNCL